jgi:hypothetical protein
MKCPFLKETTIEKNEQNFSGKTTKENIIEKFRDCITNGCMAYVFEKVNGMVIKEDCLLLRHQKK